MTEAIICAMEAMSRASGVCMLAREIGETFRELEVTGRVKRGEREAAVLGEIEPSNSTTRVVTASSGRETIDFTTAGARASLRSAPNCNGTATILPKTTQGKKG